MTDTDPPRKVPRFLTPAGDNAERPKRSKQHEKRIGRLMGGKRIPRSGGTRWSVHDAKTARGDVSTPDFHLEHKRTDCASLILKREWLEKVREGARDVLKDPGVVITFETKGKVDDWILVPLDVARRRLGLPEE